MWAWQRERNTLILHVAYKLEGLAEALPENRFMLVCVHVFLGVCLVAWQALMGSLHHMQHVNKT